MLLERLGADRVVYGAFSSYAQQQMVLARVAIAQQLERVDDDGLRKQLALQDGLAARRVEGREVRCHRTNLGRRAA